MRTKQPFALMVKPVGSNCNMRCRYCYYVDNNMSQKKIMSIETLEKMIKSYFESSCGPIVSFVFHGGEPTLAGLDFYKQVVYLEKKYLPNSWQCWNNIQTNGLSIDEKWCQFLRDNNFDVGVSIDGTLGIHDYYRKDYLGNDTYQTIVKNIKLLQKFGIQPDLLCTINSMTTKYPLEVYKSLADLNTGWIQFIPIVNKDEKGNVTSESVNPIEYGQFLIKVFDRWLYNDFNKVGIQLFLEILNMYSGGTPSLCWLTSQCGKVPVVESDGKVYSCDHYVDSNNCIGNICSNSFYEIVTSDKQITFGNDKSSTLSGKCLNCEYLALCNGGCPKDRFVNGDNYLCEGLKMLFEHTKEPLTLLTRLIKEKTSTTAIMEELMNYKKSMR